MTPPQPEYVETPTTDGLPEYVDSIQQALDVLLHGRTSFIVAHRLSTIRNADRILFIANKGIAEEGTHEQLLNKHGLYYNLYKSLNQ